MKNTNLFIRINAICLSICLFVCTLCSVKLYNVYASDYSTQEVLDSLDELPDDFDIESENDYDINIMDAPYADETNDEYKEVDPFDYDLTCYNPNINFGTVYQGDYCDFNSFSIVNIGNNEFPLTWDEYDPGMAFEISITPGASLDLMPGGQVPFAVSPNTDIAPGNYSAYYIFYSANDIRQHHRVQVNVSMTVKKAEPYVYSVEIIPATVTVPTGKTYQFTAKVSGGNNYDSSVYWSITGQNSSGTKISSDGTLSVSSDESSSSIAVIATSKQDSSCYDSAMAYIQKVEHMVSISASPAEGGAIAGGGAVRDGGSVTISASANNNYRFTGWYEGSNLISLSSQFNLTGITSDRRIVAKFERSTCYIKTNVNNTDYGTITGSSNIAYNGSITITAKAKNGYVFKEFVENNKTLSTSSSIQLNNVTTDRTITAVFVKNTFNVYVSVSPQDTGTCEGAGTYDRGRKVTIKQRAYDGYEFTGWIVNGQVVSTNSEYVINSIENDLNITASFRKKEAKTYKIVSGIANEGGSIVPSGTYVATEGGSVTYNMVPNSGYKVLTVAVDGKNIGAVSSYTFNKIGTTHTIAVAFEKIQTAVLPSQNNSTSQQSAVNKKTETPQAQYTEENANKGALPEQNVIKENVDNNKIEELDEEKYGEDTIIYADNDPEEVTVPENINPNSIIARHSLDEQTVRRLINDNAEKALLKEAYDSGIIRVTVNNVYADSPQETAQGLYYENPTISNFETVVSATLSEDEKVEAFKGTPIVFNVSIQDNTDTIDSTNVALMKKKTGYKPLCYFDFFMMKTMNGNTEIIDKTGAELVVTLNIPEEHRKNNKDYYILRNHNGEVDILADLDDNPDTITFKTDKFSQYSIAYEVVDVNKMVIRMIVIILISLVLGLICYTNLWIYRHRARKKNKW